ncbi:MAG: hypothetical protein JSS32_05420 [Verrucomicrobia bacterium]|nr:hypothetical protein [Verrucomicrobiota bacterium]
MRLLLLALLPLSLLATETLDYDMTKQERKQTGVYKLSDKEKAALQRWIDNHYEKRSQPLEGAISGKHATLQENLQNGKYIRLSDNSLWNVHPQDTPISQGWITPVDILVTQSGDSNYPYKLTNSVTGSSIRARHVDQTS